jgi:hypothetical protein
LKKVRNQVIEKSGRECEKKVYWYCYCLNNPLIYTDPDGEFWHIIIGAAIGGIINTATHWKQIDNFWDGLKAFGVGAAAGAVGAATGGAAFAAAGGAAGGAGGFIAGFAGGSVGAAYSLPILSTGNHIAFGDPMMTPGQYAAGILTGGLLGGAVNGGIALFNGNGFLRGTPKPVPSNWQSPALRVDGPEINLNLDRPSIKSFPNPQEQQTFLRVETGDGKVQWIKIQQQDLTLSPRQSLHLGNNVGSSPLTIDPSRVLNDLNKGNFQFVQLNHRGMPIVKFNYPIGNVLQQGTGINLGSTYYGTVHINGSGQIHVVPWLFR